MLVEKQEENMKQAVYLYKRKDYDMNIPIHLRKDLEKEQEKFKYLDPGVEEIRYFLEEYKRKTKSPKITCYKELSMAGFKIKSKAFSEIMANHFCEWKLIRLEKTTRIKPNRESIPVKVYYERTP